MRVTLQAAPDASPSPSAAATRPTAVTTPAAVIAGTLLMASLLGETQPFLKWSLALIAGGGTAGVVQTGSVLLRGGSTLLTGGSGNLLVAIFEFIAAAVLTVLTLMLPLLAAAVLMIIFLMLMRRLFRCVTGSDPNPKGDFPTE